MARIKQHFFEEIAGREDSPDPYPEPIPEPTPEPAPEAQDETSSGDEE